MITDYVQVYDPDGFLFISEEAFPGVILAVVLALICCAVLAVVATWVIMAILFFIFGIKGLISEKLFKKSHKEAFFVFDLLLLDTFGLKYVEEGGKNNEA